MNRADRMLAVLSSEPRPFTRAELHAAGGFYLTNNAASELRARGLAVEKTQTAGPGGEIIYMYELVDSLGEPDHRRGRPHTSLTEGHAMPISVSGSPSEDDPLPDQTGSKAPFSLDPSAGSSCDLRLGPDGARGPADSDQQLVMDVAA